MPNVPVRLKAPKPKLFLDAPKTLGDHIKRARALRDLTQKEAADLIGVDPVTVLNWEKERTEPPIAVFPAILRFLGYDPYPAAKTLPERMRALRRVHGWPIREAAHRLGVDEGTWGQWERGTPIVWKRYLALVNAFLGQNEKLSLCLFAGKMSANIPRGDCSGN